MSVLLDTYNIRAPCRTANNVLKYDPANYEVHFLPKNMSQRRFDVTYRFHASQRFYRKIKKFEKFLVKRNFSKKVLVGQIAVRGTVKVNFRNFFFEKNVPFHKQNWRFFYLAIKSLTRVEPVDNVKSPLLQVFLQKSGLYN